MNKFVIHIGPPKTATTSLQAFLHELSTNTDDFIYGGKKDNSAYLSAYNDIIYKNKRYNRCIEYHLEKKKMLLLSEENFLVEEIGLTWREKLERLADSFRSYHPTVLLTRREPKQAIISYYIQRYFSLPSYYRKNFELFLYSEYCSIYKYKSLVSYLNELELKVNVIDFEKLINGKYGLSDFFIAEDGKDYPINLKRKHSTIKKSKHYFRARTIHELLRLMLVHKVTRMNTVKKIALLRKSIEFSAEMFFLIVPDFKLPPKQIKVDFENYDYSDFIDEFNTIKEGFY